MVTQVARYVAHVERAINGHVGEAVAGQSFEEAVMNAKPEAPRRNKPIGTWSILASRPD